MISCTIETVLSALRTNTEHAINWFIDNFMQINPSKFQFMFLQKFTNKEIKHELIEVHGTSIPCKNEVKLLGITIDDKLKFDKQVDILCKNAASQLNILYSFKGIFDLKEIEKIYNTFILSNCNYCPYRLAFCGKVNIKKIEKIQERTLRFMFKDKKCSHNSLLEKCGYNSFRIRHIKTIATKVFKSLYNLNPTFMNQMFEVKTISYDLRNYNVLFQPKWQKVTYGKNNIKKLWNSYMEFIAQ